MKKSYYSDRTYEDVEKSTYVNGDAEKRKQISLETNRRRRDMALRVKRQLEREEERRQHVLRERKEKQEALNNKLRFRRKKPENTKPTKTDNIDKILEMIRVNDDKQKFSKNQAWEDSNYSQRETCESPMGRYGGLSQSPSLNGQHHNQFIPMSTNIRVHEWNNDFRRSRELESAKQFARTIEDEVTATIKKEVQQDYEKTYEQNPLSSTHTTQQSTYRKDLLSELLGRTGINDDPYKIEPAPSTNVQQPIYNSVTITQSPMNHHTTEEVIINDHLDTNSFTEQDSLDENNEINTPKQPEIKGILKKTNSLSSRLGSNSDLSITNLRDSVDIAKYRNTNNIPRSSSYSTGLSRLSSSNVGDDAGSECSLATTTNTMLNDERKAVRFADEPPKVRAVSAVNLVSAVNGASQRSSQNMRINTTITKNNQQPVAAPRNRKFNGAPSTSMIPQNTNPVPSSTPLKPPLHPTTPSTISTTSTQPNTTISLTNNHPNCVVNPSNNSSFLAAFKKQQQQNQQSPHTTVRPPKKITNNVLEKEIGAIVKRRTPSPSPKSHNNQIISQPPQPPLPHTLFNNLDKTPTEAEIDQLWAEVRETLSRNSNHSNSPSLKLSPTHQLLQTNITGGSNHKADSLISSCSSRGTIQGGYKSGGGLKSASEDGSVRSIPVWRNNQTRKGAPSGTGSNVSSNGTIRQSPVPFHVKHYNPVRPTSSTSGAPNSGVNNHNAVDKPLADKVIVHTCKGTPLTVNQYPLSVISPKRHASNVTRNNKEKISESLEEFLEMESACSSSRVNSKTNQNSYNNTPNSSLVSYNNQSNPSRVFLHRPISQYRPVLRPPTNVPNQLARPVVANHNYNNNMNYRPQSRNSQNFGSGRSATTNNNENTHRSQLSMEEEKLKASLDRLNERLKSGSTR